MARGFSPLILAGYVDKLMLALLRARANTEPEPIVSLHFITRHAHAHVHEKGRNLSPFLSLTSFPPIVSYAVMTKKGKVGRAAITFTPLTQSHDVDREVAMRNGGSLQT